MSDVRQQGPEAGTIIASEALAYGAFVNIWSVAGSARVRNADATGAGKTGHGFVLAATAAGASVVVYMDGTNVGVSGLSPGDVYLSTTPGLATSTPPSAGNIVQVLGSCSTPNVVFFNPSPASSSSSQTSTAQLHANALSF